MVTSIFSKVGIVIGCGVLVREKTNTTMSAAILGKALNEPSGLTGN